MRSTGSCPANAAHPLWSANRGKNGTKRGRTESVSLDSSSSPADRFFRSTWMDWLRQRCYDNQNSIMHCINISDSFKGVLPAEIQHRFPKGAHAAADLKGGGFGIERATVWLLKVDCRHQCKFLKQSETGNMATASNSPPHLEPNPNPPEPVDKSDAGRKRVGLFFFSPIYRADKDRCPNSISKPEVALQLSEAVESQLAWCYSSLTSCSIVQWCTLIYIYINLFFIKFRVCKWNLEKRNF